MTRRKQWESKLADSSSRLRTQITKKAYWVEKVQCQGVEASLSQCQAQLSLPRSDVPCRGGMHAVVRCIPGSQFTRNGRAPAPPPVPPVVRLKAGPRLGEGRVEVLQEGKWGTVCDHLWDMTAASVVCRELGFGTAKEALTKAQLGQGTGPIHMNSVQCTGREKSITECRYRVVPLYSCKHTQDVAIRCNVPNTGMQTTVRLAGGREPAEGRVEVLMDVGGVKRWGSVCSENWGINEAMVVCRQLGLGFASRAHQETWYRLKHRMLGGKARDPLHRALRCLSSSVAETHTAYCPRGGEGRPQSHMFVQETAHLEDRPSTLADLAPMRENWPVPSSAARMNWSHGTPLPAVPSQYHEIGSHDCNHGPEVLDMAPVSQVAGANASRLRTPTVPDGIHKRHACYNMTSRHSCYCWDTHVTLLLIASGLDITDVCIWVSHLQVEVNPSLDMAESDFQNNVMRCRCKYL
ncbi:lysyl oxidase homolog 4-like protein [Lates japonicus]|uniref:Lysyl oxidase homolog 4-like protein n=1 Tax=Lates japonicus TaxID=270547 RepID=A0AAD3QWC2_LATJO|nr:lysyl oxidase homolog 4-like protein [Lates japonicus]